MYLQTSKKKGWDKLGHMMISMHELKRAEDLYKILLDSIDNTNKKEIILLYENLGTIKFNNGSYKEAYFFFEKQLQNQQNSLPSYHSDIASTYTMIGVLNSKMGKLENALLFYQKALEIQENIFPSYHPDLAITYDNIGIVNVRMGNHLTALSFHQKALQINEKVLHSNHPNLAINYNNTASVHKVLENYLNLIYLFYKCARYVSVLSYSTIDIRDQKRVEDSATRLFEKFSVTLSFMLHISQYYSLMS
jgi:tetratricopeptide (TPR) repeat protein